MGKSSEKRDRKEKRVTEHVAHHAVEGVVKDKKEKKEKKDKKRKDRDEDVADLATQDVVKEPKQKKVKKEKVEKPPKVITPTDPPVEAPETLVDTVPAEAPIPTEESSSTSIEEPKKKKPKKDKKAPKNADSYPTFTVFPDNVKSPIGVSSLRDLVIWCLGDGINPTWMMVKNKQYIRRAVVLLVPGLTSEMFAGMKGMGEGMKPVKMAEAGGPEELGVLGDVFEWMWPTKAPGDNQRLYSPLLALLQAPLSNAEKERRAREQRRVQAQSSSKEEFPPEMFLLKLGEMEEQGYPLHTSLLPEGQAKELETDWVETKKSDSEWKTVGKKEGEYIIYGLDCEMCKTSEGNELTRVTLVNAKSEVIYDKLVMPDNEIIDYLTQWSGITEERLSGTTTKLADVQRDFMELVSSDRTILVGHSLESDLVALKIRHPLVIDTSVIYQHSRGPPYKPSLKWLAERHLGAQIQRNTGVGGHDSAEDARTAVQLLLMKMQKGVEFGTFARDVEPIFTRLQRQTSEGGVTSAVVDYGNPRALIGAGAKTCIGCQSDDDVVKGIKEAVETNHGFVFGRLRELEFAAGWGSSNREDANSEPLSPDLMSPVLARLSERIKEIYESLPPCSAFIVYTGTGNPREMSRLNAKYGKHKAEFKTKKWDELEVKWDDNDQQALNTATKVARKGLSWITLK